MNSNEALQYYTSLGLHFRTASYDFFRYRGQVAYVLDLDKRKDKLQIEKIARHPDPMGLLVANLSANPHAWSGDIVSDAGLTVYKEWQKRNEALAYTFEQDLKKLKPSLPDNWHTPPNEHPYLLKMYLGGHVCLETLVILDYFFRLYARWQRSLNSDIAWKSVRLTVVKYQPFIRKIGSYQYIIPKVFLDK